jgi:MFS family permease
MQITAGCEYYVCYLRVCLMYAMCRVNAGIGFGMMYLPAIVMVGYYFDKRRALATGIAVCGSGIGTFIMAPLASFLLDAVSWRGANIVLGAIILNGVVFGALYRPLPATVLTSCFKRCMCVDS